VAEKLQIEGNEPSHGGRWFVVFAVLCALTAVSFWVANSQLMTENRFLGQVLMLAISCGKALIVVLCFMHLWWERAWKFAVTIPALIIAVVLTISLIPDVGYRGIRYSSVRLKFVPVESGESDKAMQTSRAKE
jgi:cytochrome c oxidase subunit IV